MLGHLPAQHVREAPGFCQSNASARAHGNLGRVTLSIACLCAVHYFLRSKPLPYAIVYYEVQFLLLGEG